MLDECNRKDWEEEIILDYFALPSPHTRPPARQAIAHPRPVIIRSYSY